MKRAVGGSFHFSTDGKSGYPDGVVRGQIVDLDEADVRRYMHHDVDLVELVGDKHY
jgi:hypothetical protein